MNSQHTPLITLLTLVAIVGFAIAAAVTAGVLRRLTGSAVPAAILTGGTAFAGTVALLLSVAVAVGLF